MKKFIFRLPYVMKDQEKKANNWLSVAKCYHVLASSELELNEGVVSPTYMRYLSELTSAMRKACLYFGFISVADMTRYIDIHGHV